MSDTSRASWLHVGVGVIVLGLLVWSIFPRVPTHAHPSMTASSDSQVPAQQRLESAMSALGSAPSTARSVQNILDQIPRSEIGFVLPDGQHAPPLPASAPHRVRIGVILVRYRGAQLTPENAKNKPDAHSHAEWVRELAARNFEAAVALGDVGSSPDIGYVSQGVLEPATEYLVFSLGVHDLSPVLDTPRGFWIVRRLD
jgi:hypothetical protein